MLNLGHAAPALVAGMALGAWAADPGLLFAAVALIAGLVALGGVRRQRPLTVLPAVLALAGGVWAVRSALAVHRVETAWPAVREALVEEGRRGLDNTLGDAVALARLLADRALAAGGAERAQQFRLLDAALRPGAPEHGVALRDTTGRALAWAGRHRLPPVAGESGLVASITGFYAVLSERRQEGAWVAQAQVLLAADSTVPDRDRTVAARFERRTGTGLAFFAPQAVPREIGDVFDYCLPECRPASGRADTLFSVQIVPPTQGAQKLRLLGAAGKVVAVIAALTFVAVAVTAGPAGRYVALAGGVWLLVFTPAGERLGAGGLFSPAAYFSPVLGAASASAGALGLTAALVALVAIGLSGREPRVSLLRRVLAAALGGAAPLAVRFLSRGITPPVEGTTITLWMTWDTTLTVAGAAVFLVAAWVGGPWPIESGRRLAWVAAGAAALLGAAGIVTWQPGTGWGAWYVLAWIPVAMLAVQPVRSVGAAVTVAIVAGSMAGTFTWDGVLRGRLALAERDASRLGAAADPIGAGLLEALGRAARDAAPPASAADLYRLWGQSALSRDDYPAVLVAWDSAERLTARLDLATLDLPTSLLQAIASTARAGGSPIVEAFPRVPGMHYVLAVPHPSGAVTMIGLGPLSRIFVPLRVGRFLRGEQEQDPPYELFLAEPTSRPLAAGHEWRREGWVIRGERVLGVPGGPRRVYVAVALRDLAQHVIRGTLAAAVNAAVIVLLWWVGAFLAGRGRVASALRAAVGARSYRARLALMLGVFFVGPTVGFAAWSVARLEAEARRSGRLLTRQTLRDAGVAAREIGASVPHDREAGERLVELAGRFGADFVLYSDGQVTLTSLNVLEEFGLLDRYLPPEVVGHLLIEDDVEASADVSIGGRRTRVAYRALGMMSERSLVLAAPRLVDEPELLREQEDLMLAVLLATVLGLLAAAALATFAARALAEPVHVLRSAAETFGRGRVLPTVERDVPLEFVPVVQGLERMAADVRASQAALESARQRTAAVLRSVATGVVALDRELRVTTANPKASELLGVPLPDGTAVLKTTGASWKPLWDWVAGYLSGTAADDAHELVVEERRIRAQIASLGDDGGCVVALDDTTELAHAVRVLAWGELARQIAHEIKNPLTPIRLGVQHLERAYRDRRGDFGDALERTAQQILAEIERLDAIARAFARFGAPPAEAGPVTSEDLGGVARETAQLYALGAGIRVEVQAEAGIRGRVRRDEFKEVLVNLIENARNATARRVTIAIRPDGAARRTLVSVSDDGSGIAAEHLSRIFEPQFSTTTSGAGLGLAICKRLTEGWGGTIVVQSAPGEGTVVTLSIPT